MARKCIQRLLARHGIQPETVTLVLDQGRMALANTVLLKEAGLAWVSDLPRNHARADSCQCPMEE